MRPRDEIKPAILQALALNGGSLTSNKLHEATNTQLRGNGFNAASKPVIKQRLDDLVEEGTITRERTPGPDDVFNLPVTYKLNYESAPLAFQKQIDDFLKGVEIDRQAIKEMTATERRLVFGNYLKGIEYAFCNLLVVYAFDGLHVDLKKIHVDVEKLVSLILEKARKTMHMMKNYDKSEIESMFNNFIYIRKKAPYMMTLERYREDEAALKEIRRPKTKEALEQQAKEDRVVARALYAMYKEFAKENPKDPEIQKLLRDLEKAAKKDAKKRKG